MILWRFQSGFLDQPPEAATGSVAPAVRLQVAANSALSLQSLASRGAVLLGRNPNGLAIYVFRAGRWAQGQLAPRLLASLPALPSSEEQGLDGDAEEDAAETASRNPDGLVDASETVVTEPASRGSGPAEPREVPAHVVQ